uniref:Uncharacterized protein n=1 Tax=Arundo donax TaxID=35708 RepID=A0A0A9DYA7_ARUDO
MFCTTMNRLRSGSYLMCSALCFWGFVSVFRGC